MTGGQTSTQSNIIVENIVQLPQCIVLVSSEPKYELHTQMLEFYYGYVLLPEMTGLKPSSAGISKFISKLKDTLHRLDHPEAKKDQIEQFTKQALKGASIRRSKNFYFLKVKEFMLSFFLSYHLGEGREPGSWTKIAVNGEFKRINILSYITKTEELIEYPLFETNIAFEYLSNENIFRTINALLLEEKVIFVSSRDEYLTELIMMFLELIKPL